MVKSIIPVEYRERFRDRARSRSEAHWADGDDAIIVIRKFREAQRQGSFGNTHEISVWNAIGQLCGGVSGKRIKMIAAVCANFPEEYRDAGVPFGYYEQAVALEDKDRLESIRFYLECKEQGELIGVGEFLYKYRLHVLGENIVPVRTVYDPSYEAVDWPMIDMEQGSPLPFQDWIRNARLLRTNLVKYDYHPGVKEFLEIIGKAEALLPLVMRETGINVPERVDIKG